MNTKERYMKAIKAMEKALIAKEEYLEAMREASSCLTASDLTKKSSEFNEDVKLAFKELIANEDISVSEVDHVKTKLNISENKWQTISLHQKLDDLGCEALYKLVDELDASSFISRDFGFK
jgi:hypothetical protein